MKQLRFVVKIQFFMQIWSFQEHKASKGPSNLNSFNIDSTSIKQVSTQNRMDVEANVEAVCSGLKRLQMNRAEKVHFIFDV